LDIIIDQYHIHVGWVTGLSLPTKFQRKIRFMPRAGVRMVGKTKGRFTHPTRLLGSANNHGVLTFDSLYYLHHENDRHVL